MKNLDTKQKQFVNIEQCASNAYSKIYNSM